MHTQDYEQIVDRIIQSKSFGRSLTYANLLRYLARCTAAENVPKEATIAAEIFGKEDYDPSQSTLIRVYMYKLREKLAAYYVNEGSEEPDILTIPKGSYALQLSPRHSRPRKSKKKLVAALILLLVAAAGMYMTMRLTGPDTRPAPLPSLWSDLQRSRFPTTVLLGDLFIFNEEDPERGTTRTIRDAGINSLREFESFKEQQQPPHLTWNPATYGLLIQGSAHWIKNLTEMFGVLGKDYSIRTMSRFNPKEIQDQDLLVVGMLKTLGLFRDFFPRSRLLYDAELDGIRVSEGGESKVYAPFGDPNGYHTDYAVLTKVPGPNGNAVYVFGGIWDTGATQSLKIFTDSQLALDLEEEMKTAWGAVPKYYEVLIEVSGLDRMELTSRVVYLHSVD
ncbi:MAG: winged helix-turn-helix domain-containing protein [Lunatimonas sp.]|nr:winged helix-turn-helix domain-containing protein [Lunatimonas sp.]